MKIIKEFREFAIKGNMFDMAIGIIIGVAFNKIVSSLVNDIITPVFGLVLGKVNFQNLKVVIQEEIKTSTGEIEQELITLNYGIFIQSILDFLIIAMTVFLIVKGINKLRAKADNEKDDSVPTPKDIQLLSEIRDLLKSNKQ
ncbi:large-conductance mechanosensitive channel protein MscL [Fulvivirga lutea]|uniref:Large-conductance mechanosensitive channel n=1 Tax=Fulvivirga lutea TaxID=2810512 RepID=A0A974WJR9_9BACT|nr:large-conductance mechanosensitive channel protein MscL [Fulvivirga lutea]QSE99244.1 large-conductance mechanosensitive channel protein MscL [Fulvivirga lutea]